MPQLLWSRLQLTLPVGATTVSTNLRIPTERYAPYDQPAASRVMVIPLMPTASWTGITHDDPAIVSGIVNVVFTNANAVPTTINVLFWDPHSILGTGYTEGYV